MKVSFIICATQPQQRSNSFYSSTIFSYYKRVHIGTKIIQKCVQIVNAQFIVGMVHRGNKAKVKPTGHLMAINYFLEKR